MKAIVEVLALVIAGPMVGVEIAVAAFTNPVFARLSDDAFRVARSDGSRVLGKVMPFWYIATLVVLVACAVATGADPLITVAAVVMAVIVLITVTLMVPLNNRIGRWAETDEVSREDAARWDRLHWVRVALLMVLFVLLTLGITL